MKREELYQRYLKNIRRRSQIKVLLIIAGVTALVDLWLGLRGDLNFYHIPFILIMATAIAFGICGVLKLDACLRDLNERAYRDYL